MVNVISDLEFKTNVSCGGDVMLKSTPNENFILSIQKKDGTSITTTEEKQIIEFLGKNRCYDVCRKECKSTATSILLMGELYIQKDHMFDGVIMYLYSRIIKSLEEKFKDFTLTLSISENWKWYNYHRYDDVIKEEMEKKWEEEIKKNGLNDEPLNGGYLPF